MLGSYLALPLHDGEAYPASDLRHCALEYRLGLQGRQPSVDRITAAFGKNTRPPKYLEAVHHSGVAVAKIREPSAYPTIYLAVEFAFSYCDEVW